MFHCIREQPIPIGITSSMFHTIRKNKRTRSQKNRLRKKDPPTHRRCHRNGPLPEFFNFVLYFHDCNETVSVNFSLGRFIIQARIRVTSRLPVEDSQVGPACYEFIRKTLAGFLRKLFYRKIGLSTFFRCKFLTESDSFFAYLLRNKTLKNVRV